MQIELLYSSKCPNHDEALQNLIRVLKRNGWPAGIHSVEIKDLNQAKKVKFLGSPTIRVNGQDLEKDVEKAGNFSLDCRTYLIKGKSTSVPTEDFIEEGIKRILEKQKDI